MIKVKPTYRFFPGKEICGLHQKMSHLKNATAELWRNFHIIGKKENAASADKYYSLQNYPANYPFDFSDLGVEFEKWAAMEIPEGGIPTSYSRFTIPPGNYAVFEYEAGPAQAAQFFQYVFAEWLPASGLKLDNRPHFEILPANYIAMKGLVKEEVWIPITTPPQ